MATKKEKLENLDELLLTLMINIMEDVDEEKVEELSSLSVPMNYLRNNQVVSDKPRSTVEDDTKKRLEAAAKRRAKKESI